MFFVSDGLSLANLDSRLIWHGYSYICCCLPNSQRKRLKRLSVKRKNLNQEYSEVKLSEKSVQL